MAIILSLTLFLGGSVGWIRNIIAITQSDFNHIDGELVVRVIGVPMVPVGSVMGWLP
jgi:hypothetical protein